MHIAFPYHEVILFHRDHFTYDELKRQLNRLMEWSQGGFEEQTCEFDDSFQFMIRLP